jgi:trans-2,3-dihydro-3-hydroxyanthranilate isomerase
MPRFSFVTVDVFTDRRFGGNPLAVFPDARGMSDRDMQALAAEFNLSETTFVLPPADPANTARVRIFNRPQRDAVRRPSQRRHRLGARETGRATNGVLRFEEIAGLVEIEAGADVVTIAAPQPLSLGPEMPAELVAGCVGLGAGDVVTRRTGRSAPRSATPS